MKKNAFYHFFNKTIVKHIVFWLIVLVYQIIIVNWSFYRTFQEAFDNMLVITIVQIIVAYITLYILIPKYLNTKKYILFGTLFLLSLTFCVFLYHTTKVYYLEPTYPELYASQIEITGYLTVWERLSLIPVTISKFIKFLAPTLFLLLFQFYRNQQRLAKINEQKKIAELSALKHQLNPHFLFNTLNNLYVLSLKKSSKTPNVIEKLSHILDYMLYRCNDTFVDVQNEIDLIENYLALEKIRYGSRVNMSFTHNVNRKHKIAPLILLTFIENAFKHGVSQELDKAYISIEIVSNQSQIVFKIENSKSKEKVDQRLKKSIGLENVQKQLSLVYHDKYDLDIDNQEDKYIVILTLEGQ